MGAWLQISRYPDIQSDALPQISRYPDIQAVIWSEISRYPSKIHVFRYFCLFSYLSCNFTYNWYVSRDFFIWNEIFVWSIDISLWAIHLFCWQTTSCYVRDFLFKSYFSSSLISQKKTNVSVSPIRARGERAHELQDSHHCGGFTSSQCTCPSLIVRAHPTLAWKAANSAAIGGSDPADPLINAKPRSSSSSAKENWCSNLLFLWYLQL